MASKTLQYKIGADIGELRREMESAGTLTRKMQRELSEMEAKQRQHRQTMVDLGQGFMTFGALATAGLVVAAKAAMDWETAWTGVRKTVDGSDAEMAALEGELRKMARTLPATHKEIAAVAEAAGQLGIKRDDIAKFTKTMIDLGNTTNLTAEEAATGLAKFSNIMGTSAKDVDRLGSSLVALGNDGASTEKDILEMALRIAGAGKTIGLAESDVLGLASALSSVGITAEGGGSSISTTMVKIASSVQSGGASLRAFAKVAGVSSDEFATKFRNDAAGAITLFVQGLGKMQAAGGNVFATLDELGLNTNEVRDTLLRASGASDLFAKSLRVGSSAWAENTALVEEANKRYETGASKLQVAGNQIKDALIDVGAVVGPVFAGMAQGAADLVKFWQSLPGPIKEVVTWAGVAAAAVTLFGGAALIAVPKILMFRESMRTMVATGGAMSGALGKFGLFMSGPWGAALGLGATLLGIFGIAAGGAQRRQEELAASASAVADAIAEQNGVINQNVRSVAAAEAQKSGLLALGKTMKLDLGLVTDALLSQGNAYDEIKRKTAGFADAYQKLVVARTQGAPIDAAAIQAALDQKGAGEDLIAMLDTQRSKIGADLEAKKNVAAASKSATGATKDQTAATQDMAKQAEEAAAALESMRKALDSINGVTLSYREAQRSFIEQVNEANKAIEGTDKALIKSGQALDINTQAGRDNQRALDATAQSALELAEAASREAEANGGATAGAAALTASLEASRPTLLAQARAFGMNEAAAKAYVDQVLSNMRANGSLVPSLQSVQGELIRVRDAVNGVPPEKRINVGVLSQEAMERLRMLGYTVTALPDGTVTVHGNTHPANSALNGLLNTINKSVATVNVKLNTPNNFNVYGNAVGNFIRFADGGTYGGDRENQVSQIARTGPGVMRIWAEDPRAKWEAYITEDPRVRSRSLGILGKVADEFGYAIVPRSQMVRAFGQGGMVGTAAPASGGWTGPVTLNATFIDSDGTFIGRMQGVAQAALDSAGRDIYLAGGRR